MADVTAIMTIEAFKANSIASGVCHVAIVSLIVWFLGRSVDALNVEGRGVVLIHLVRNKVDAEARAWL